MSNLEESLYQLIVETSTNLASDIEASIREAAKEEEPGSNADRTFKVILKNIELARENRQPVCQDTGTINFYVEAPEWSSYSDFKKCAELAIIKATENGILRQNSVDSLTGKNSGNNLGKGSPVIHWHENNDIDQLQVTLMLKGGGCENVGTQYSLPDSRLNAGRNLEGVRKCVLDAVQSAMGKGCAPGFIGVGVGGDRTTGYEESKEQLLRIAGSRNEVKEVAELEETLISQANTLGIGPMGFGGKTTVFDVFIGFRNRLPASFFVSISYMCWAFRRRQVLIKEDGTIAKFSI